MKKISLGEKLKKWLQQERRVFLTASGVAGSIIILRIAGLLQTSELATLDQLMLLRPPEPVDERVVIVKITEADIKKWPITDKELAILLKKIDTFKPRAIGLDIYRNLVQEPGHKELVNTAKSIPNLIGIQRIKDEKSPGVAPPPFLSKEQIGFNNFPLDTDGKVRRNLLYVYDQDGNAIPSFAITLAEAYLKAQGVESQSAVSNPNYLQLGKTVFSPFATNDGGYVGADDGGYQILGNFRSPDKLLTVSMADVLANKVPANKLRDRIVIIGLQASSFGDLFYTPYSSKFFDAAEPFFGVQIHANFTSQIINAVLDGRPLIKVWSDFVESLWILAWSYFGASLSWKLRSPKKSTVSMLLAGSGLIGICYLGLLAGYWIPLIPSIMALFGSAITITSYIAHLEEELQRSKEFLQTVINTIADPIFVKDKQHRWIILNQAYCKFIGYSYEILIYKSEYDFFPKEQADNFWKQDELVFSAGKGQENEEEFTDVRGNTHIIATKRSLHKDAAGNLFLVAVIRDITERKRIEEDLKKTAAELMRSNEELQLSGNQLRHLAYHDNLTGLPNRKQFYERLKECLEDASSNNKLVALLFLDLDGFKQVNDTLGHDTGDKLLKIVAQRLQGCLRGGDTVSRLGGDEFTVILPTIRKEQDAAIVAEKILATLAQPYTVEEHNIEVTVSIGISIYPLHGDSLENLIKQADVAMYAAKDLGRNRYELAGND
ncbi:diguanylate cyclase with PAS/PAC and Chase2 sensors [Crinalium epipsammum PCC 9333]|uniref:Diguanylate cyclase with PAS/PAC and Chase2 sensors n=1 Tax=Crinalium epipsammum PCC 9333 TaxID=1173022 RepID=K9W5S6_9CYAN|nr:CHASE2 domain-containing protein [Crinalium epipsammum]AFZ15149.1 diguanylate cyclase with PAS/PAC and Chase2 sensors [Crinalium epipsammum PCC 9333]